MKGDCLMRPCCCCCFCSVEVKIEFVEILRELFLVIEWDSTIVLAALLKTCEVLTTSFNNELASGWPLVDSTEIKMPSRPIGEWVQEWEAESVQS